MNGRQAAPLRTWDRFLAHSYADDHRHALVPSPSLLQVLWLQDTGDSRKPKQPWHFVVVVRFKEITLGRVAGETLQGSTKHAGEWERDEAPGGALQPREKVSIQQSGLASSSKQVHCELQEKKQNNKQYLALQIRVETTKQEAVFT